MARKLEAIFEIEYALIVPEIAWEIMYTQIVHLIKIFLPEVYTLVIFS